MYVLLRLFCILLCSLLPWLAALPCTAASRDAVPEISDYGWKVLTWGMSPRQAQSAFLVQGQPLQMREVQPRDLLAGFDSAWNPVEIPAAAMETDAGGLLLATDYNSAVLLFHEQRLFGVYIDRSSPQHIQDSLFKAMRRRYPGARSIDQGPGRSSFQHFAGNRRIVWQGRPTGFTLAFYDPGRMPAGVQTGHEPALTPVFMDSPAFAPEEPPRDTPEPPPPTPDGTTWTEPDSGLEFLYIPAGCFQRRSPRLESPQRVCTEAFWISLDEVGREALASCSQPSVSVQSQKSGETSGLGPAQDPAPSDLPAVDLGRMQALEFTDCLDRRHPDRDFALPTTAQWEYAARAGAGGTAPWSGYGAACEWGNFADQSAAEAAPGLKDIFPCDDGHPALAPVGSGRANAWGLHDMLGNAAEWCFPSEYDLDVDVSVCGGSFRTGPAATGYFSRRPLAPDATRDDVGLRVVMQQTGAAGPPDASAAPPVPGQVRDRTQPRTLPERVPPGLRPAIEDLM